MPWEGMLLCIYKEKVLCKPWVLYRYIDRELHWPML